MLKYKLVKVWPLLLMILYCPVVFSQNPIVPPGIYIADPSAHVWDDGKIYIYGSTDESPDYYCSWRHDVLFSDDLATWTLVPDVFTSKGVNDQVPESDKPLYAPDCQYHNGTYYLYYCLPDKEFTEGVATSISPTGPFTGGRNIPMGGYNQIDPCIFIDDDGQVYYIWGQFTAKMARMNPGMTSLDLSSIRDSVLTESEHFFHEGGYMVKRNGIYYFIYADISRAQAPTCIGYSTSASPMGPFKYGGVIIDNDHCDPGNWNNHGSIAEFNGQWYVFYHRSTHGCNTMRKACIEPITFLGDGSIPEVEMTSQGAGPPLDAFKTIEAERACLLFGNVRILASGQGNEELGEIRDDDRVAYKYINFGDGAGDVSIRTTTGEKSRKIVFFTDVPFRNKIGMVEIPPGTQEWKGWTTITVDISKTSGVHSLWLRFYADDKESWSVDWIRFGKKEH